MDATPSVALPDNAGRGVPATPPAPMRIGSRTFAWGERTYVMGVVNVTPDSFSGDGLLATGSDFVNAAVEQARGMVDERADLIDVGAESTRPGYRRISIEEEIDRAIPVVRELRAALPNVPISIDTTRSEVAAAALDAGADLVNDIWGVAAEDEMLRLAAERGVPIVL